jgi:protein dithiol oxidoreductase (disulfide-forming)
MRRFISTCLALFALAIATDSFAQTQWKEGTHYFAVNPVQPTTVGAGKVEVMEVFSYGCPACNSFLPYMRHLKESLPANAKVVYLPASFNPQEDWPMFQQAFFAAQALGVADKAHDAMFNAVWGTGELGVSDPVSHRLRSPLPTIEDTAKFYQRTTGVKPEDFLAAAKSFGVSAKQKMADKQITDMQALSTPTIIVNGKYRVLVSSAGGTDQLIELVKFLVAKESH